MVLKFQRISLLLSIAEQYLPKFRNGKKAIGEEAMYQDGISLCVTETDLNNNFEIREKMEFKRRRRVSAPAKPYGGSEKLKNKLERGFYGGGKKRSQSALLISPSWQSFDREDVDGDPLDTSWDYIEEMMKDNKKAETIKLLKTQQVRGSVKALSPRTTAETTTTLKQLKKEISRKFSRARSDSKYSLIPWMDCSDWEEPLGDFIPVEFNLGFLDDYM